MTEHTEYGISDDVLERAAEAIYTNVFGPVWDHDHPSIVNDLPYDDWCEAPAVVYPEGGITPDMLRSAVRAALPVLIPAIETALVQEMIAEAGRWVAIKEDKNGRRTLRSRRQNMGEWLRTYLPATEEAPDAQ